MVKKALPLCDVAIEPCPNAALFTPVTTEFIPIATPPVTAVFAPSPMTTALAAFALAPVPIATAFSAVAAEKAPIDNALSRINHIDGVFFKYQDSGDKSIGFIAQQIQKVLPEVVSEDNNGYLGVNYSGVTAVLVEAIREQSSIISDLESRLSKLENK